MFTLIERDIATFILDTSTIIILAGLTVYSSVFRRRGRAEDKLFLAMIIINALMAVSDAIGSVFDQKPMPQSGVLATIGWDSFYILFYAFLIAFVQYSRARRGNVTIDFKSWLWPFFIPGYLYIILLFITPLNGWIFYYDDNNIFQMGKLFIPLYVVYLFYLILGFGNMSLEVREKNLKMAVPVWLFMVPIIAGVAIAFVIPASASFGPLALAFTLTIMYMGSLSEIVATNSKRA